MSRVPQDSRMYGSDPRDIPEPYNIYQFYSASDGPWFPASVIQPAETLNTQSRPSAYNSGTRGFQGYRSTGLPSECGTAPEDSGYGGTRSTYSIVESVTSITENDRCTETGYLETQTAEQLIGDLNINSAVPIYQPSQMPHHQTSHIEYRCDQCETTVKTKSELKKHSHRHNRPYKCTYEDCPKGVQGFSTPNDLTRHKRTVHREHSAYGPVYICRHDPCCKKEKLWPRADNFRSHLSRAHNIHLKADNDLGGYRHQLDAAKSHELRDSGCTVTDVDPGRQPMQLQDPPPVYTCRHDPCAQTKDRTWPSAGDFRAHLARAHNMRFKPDNDLKYYHHQSETAEAHALRGVGSSVADVDPGPRPAQLQDSPDLRGDQASTTASGQVQNESSKQSSLPLTQTCLPSGDKPRLMRSSLLDDLKMPSVPDPEPLANNSIVDMASAAEVSLEEPETTLPRDEARLEAFDQDEGNLTGDEEEILDRQEPSTLQVVSRNAPVQPKADAPQCGITETQNTTDEPSDASEACAQAPADNLTFDSRQSLELFSFLKNIPLDRALRDGTSDVLSFLRNIPKDLLEKALNPEDKAGSGNDVPSDQAENHKAPETCSECQKVFSRKCELRKHMKRHEKPYGCTYKMCQKTFGSKNDWKRHESSQHFQLESWNCDILNCNKVLPRRELFKMHLRNYHKVQDSQEIENKLESRRLGRHCDPRFWCGFCDGFVEIEGEVANSWTKRCDHIDSHLFGKDGLEKKTMSEWRYLEDRLEEGVPEGKVAEGDPAPRKKRKATEDVNVRPSKRANYNSWTCCRCSVVESYHISSCCQDCQHQRCENCPLEATVVLDYDTEMMNQEED